MNSLSGLPRNFPVHMIPRVVAAIRKAYEVNFEHYDPVVAGHDGWTFGVQVHRSSCHFLTEEFEGETGVTVKPLWNSAELQASGFVMRPQRLHNVERGIWGALPNNPLTAEAMAEENERATPTLPGVDWREPTHFIIGHSGTPEGGCATIHLCAPVKRGEKLLGWELAMQVFGASTEDTIADDRERKLAPSEEVPNPLVELLDEEDEEEGGV